MNLKISIPLQQKLQSSQVTIKHEVPPFQPIFRVYRRDHQQFLVDITSGLRRIDVSGE